LCVLPLAADQAEEGVAPAPDSAMTGETVWSLADVGLVRTELPRPLLRVTTPPQRSTFMPRRFDSVESLVARLRQDGLG
jgi:hypothetical protein